jgi:hypothetical protein
MSRCDANDDGADEPTAGRRGWVVAVGVEWAERSEPADACVALWPGRRNPGMATGPADGETGLAGQPAPDQEERGAPGPGADNGLGPGAAPGRDDPAGGQRRLQGP